MKTAPAIQDAARTWATSRKLDLEKLDAGQQKAVIADVAASAKIPAAQVLDALIGLWSKTNEDRGLAFAKGGGDWKNQGASVQQPLAGSVGAQLANKLAVPRDVAVYQAVPNDSRANELSNQAFALDKAGNSRAAIPLYQQALELAPNDHRLHNRLGLALKHEGDLDGATRAVAHALELSPDFGPARYNQACLRLAQGDQDGGLASLLQAVTIDPKFFGELAARDKDLDSVRSNPVVVALTMTAPPAAKEIARGAFDKVVGNFEKVDNETRVGHLSSIGFALDKSAYPLLAISVYDAALKDAPNDHRVHNRKGLAEKHLGNLDAAMKSVSASLDIEPGFGPAHYNAACIHVAQGDLAAGAASLAKAMLADPAFFGKLAQSDSDLAALRT